MSFIDNAAELLDRTEASLSALIADALKAKAYREIATIAAMAEALAVIGPGRQGQGQTAGAARRATTTPDVGTEAPATADAAKGWSEPSWMRPKA
jgi:hypothetical protein